MGSSESVCVCDLVCKKCGRIIRGVRLCEVDRKNPVCAACNKCTANTKTIQCGRCFGACIVDKSYFPKEIHTCDKCADVVREIESKRHQALEGSRVYALEY